MKDVRNDVTNLLKELETPIKQPGTYKITGNVNLREGASTDTKILATLSKGSIIKVEEIDGGSLYSIFALDYAGDECACG